MAKQQVSNKGQGQKGKMAKVILSVKSTKTGAYTFKEFILPQEEALKMLDQQQHNLASK